MKKKKGFLCEYFRWATRGSDEVYLSCCHSTWTFLKQIDLHAARWVILIGCGAEAERERPQKGLLLFFERPPTTDRLVSSRRTTSSSHVFVLLFTVAVVLYEIIKYVSHVHADRYLDNSFTSGPREAKERIDPICKSRPILIITILSSFSVPISSL